MDLGFSLIIMLDMGRLIIKFVNSPRKWIFQSEARLVKQSQFKIGTKTKQYLKRPEGMLED